MRWLRSGASRRDRDEGAVAVIAAVLVSGGVVMGMLALTVDVGTIMAERRQLQNGADSAAMALAAACGAGQTTSAGLCASTANAKAGLEPLASANAQDKAAAIPQAGICDQGAATPLPDCTSTGSGTVLTECVPLPTWAAGAPYVEVRAQTRNPGDTGPSILPKYFSQALAGGPGPDVSVSACARAAWVPLSGSGVTLPLVIGQCEWMLSPAGQGNYAPPPPYTSQPPGNSSTPLPVSSTFVMGIQAHDDKGVVPESCRKGPAQFYPGGFGWVDNVGCKATITVGSTLPGNGGTSVPDSCKTTNPATGRDTLADWVGKTVFIPIVDDVSGSDYHVAAVAAFFLAGYDKQPSSGTYEVYKQPGGTCAKKCVWGWFTTGALPVSAVAAAAPDMGAKAVIFAG